MKLHNAQLEMLTVAKDVHDAQKSELDNVNQKFMAQQLPPVTLPQFNEMEEIDALRHPNKWRELHKFGWAVSYSLSGRGDELDGMVKSLFSHILPYAALLSFEKNYHRSVINIIYDEDAAKNTSEFTFIGNDGNFIHQISRLLTTKDKESVYQQIPAALTGWKISKKAAFVGGASIEINYEPDSKAIHFKNAPIFEGENTDSALVLNNLVFVNDSAAKSIQKSTGKVLAFVGREMLVTRYSASTNGRVVINFDITDKFDFEPNLLRLLYHIFDKGNVNLDLFRISVDDPEVWDYAYEAD